MEGSTIPNLSNPSPSFGMFCTKRSTSIVLHEKPSLSGINWVTLHSRSHWL